MSIENASVVDAMGLERSTGTVVLTVSDHLEWKDESAHLRALQDKLNAYLDFIQSGQLIEENPEARGRGIRIDVFAKHVAPPSVGASLQSIRETLSKIDVGFEYRRLPLSHDEGELAE